jgi:beta-lactamase class A
VTPAPTETAVPEETRFNEGHIDLDGFEAALEELVRDVDGTVAVSLASADGTVLWEMNPDETMEAASLYKLAIMVEVYRQQAEGLLTFEDAIELTGAHFNEGEDSFSLGDIGAAVDIETLLTTMITQSSNVAAYALLELVGSANVNATMTDLGLEGIEIRWSPQGTVSEDPAPEESEEIEPDVETDETDDFVDEPEPEESEEPSGAVEPEAGWLSVGTGVTATLRGETAFNVIQASDLAQLLVLMLNGSVVNEGASQQMLDLLARQKIYGGLPELLPEGSVAHKTGYLEDGVVNDAGVIYTPRGPMVAVVLTEGIGEEAAYDITSQIGLLLYQLGSD